MHRNLCLHTFTHIGDYSKKLIAAEKCIVESEKLIERLEKKYYSLKMHICLEYPSILYDKINSACLRKSTIPLMFQALKWTCHNSTSRESQEKMFWRAKRDFSDANLHETNDF